MNNINLLELEVGSKVRWNGTNTKERGNTEDAYLISEKFYEVLAIDTTDCTIKIEDQALYYVWVDTIDFEIVPLEEQYKKQMEEHSKKLEEYYKKLGEHNKSLKLSSKNFSATVVGNLFKVEAIGLSEEKINKIMDILCK